MDEVFDVPAALEGERLDRALALLTGLTRKEVDDIVAAGRVQLGSAPASSRSRRIHAGEHIRVTGGTERQTPAAPGGEEGVPFEVVWSDSELVVVDKPAGVVVHPGSGNRSATLVNGLLDRFPDMAGAFSEPEAAQRPGVVHRLDKGTSGLLVFARTPAALESLQHQMASRSARREYLALVAGDLESDRGLIDAPIGRSARDPVRMQVQAGGRRARTSYEVVERFGNPASCCLVRCRLETGRTHQIRVHFASIGHPVVGDDRYGTRRLGSREPLKLGRQFLHATMLSFDHPSTGERLSFESPLPADLAAVLDELRGC
ncbi:MAG TPA: RluA family pseudouridine synthase [Acidimicrobiales bacterium]|nr:RluA family pseudouridine synthase [Acidimicrobiales bacterium]